MRTSRWIAAVLFGVTLVAVIEAQPPGGGGFRLGGGGGLTAQVLTSEALQTELKVTSEQKEKFRPLTAKQREMQQKMMSAFKDAAGDQDKLKEVMTDLREQGEKFQAELKTAMDETLTADQKTRLKQIERQQAGVRAFLADDVAKDLKLNDDQKGKVKGITDDLNKDMREMFGGGKGGFGKGGFDKEAMAENMKKMEKLNKAALSEIDEVLTADQKKQWKEMVGAPFDLTKLNQFGGFGGVQGKGKGKGKAKD